MTVICKGTGTPQDLGAAGGAERVAPDLLGWPRKVGLGPEPWAPPGKFSPWVRSLEKEPHQSASPRTPEAEGPAPPAPRSPSV